MTANTSGIITLTTDFGMTDAYVAMMKGVILTINPGARLVDVTHLVPRGDIPGAARLIHETRGFFPPGTVHLVVVDPGVGGPRRPIALTAGGQVFVGPDNGVFSWVLHDHADARIYHLTETRYFLSTITRTFHGRDIFGPAASHLSRGVPPQVMGERIEDPVLSPPPEPGVKEETLTGAIIGVDHFGNCITNITAGTLRRFLRSARPVIQVGGVTLPGLKQTYSDVEAGRLLALIGSSGYLEIAVNNGRASDYLDLPRAGETGAPVTVRRA